MYLCFIATAMYLVKNIENIPTKRDIGYEGFNDTYFDILLYKSSKGKS